jgi:hypothetical protein
MDADRLWRRHLTRKIANIENYIDKIVTPWQNKSMEREPHTPAPSRCPVCNHDLAVTRLQCPSCGTEVAGSFSLGRLARLPEPYASLIELFLRVRGNVKEMERELGLSYPTVRARLEEALSAAGLGREPAGGEDELVGRRSEVLDLLEQGEISAAEAAERLRELGTRR